MVQRLRQGLLGGKKYDRTAWCINFAPWKRAHLQHCFPELNLRYISFKDSIEKSGERVLRTKNPVFIVWGMKYPSDLIEFSKKNNVPIWWMEDGFLRSVGLGANHIVPYSLCLDEVGIYFDATRPSGLENLLNTYDFNADKALMKEARDCLTLLLSQRLTKYNEPSSGVAGKVYGPKRKKRILVLGQNDDDASILFGSQTVRSARELLAVAISENPDAQIIYKPHPDVLANRRSAAQVRDFAGRVTILEEPTSLDDALTGVDRVYTITSLGGLEALLRGYDVTVMGSPFYAGWGLTDDREKVSRRGRALTADQLFAASYILYPKYFDPGTGEPINLRQTIDAMAMETRGERAPVVFLEGGAPPATPAPARREGAAKKKVVAVKKGAAPQQVPERGPARSPTEAFSVPYWFQDGIGYELKAALASDKPVFVYVPWIKEHGDKVIGRIASPDDYTIAPLEIFRGIDDNTLRRDIFRFAREMPDLYRRLLIRALVPLRSRIAGVIFTFDWAPIMRQIATVCGELEIPRILIPHESVFVSRDMYYVDPLARASVPIADIVFAWGDLQKEIFLERGYPARSLVITGAPKFDPYHAYKPSLTRAQYHGIFGLNPGRKTIIFATQPLDSQLDTKAARSAQCEAIKDLFDYALAHDMQLIVRLPPSKDDILIPALRNQIEISPQGAVDDAVCYLAPPEEALYHADLVTSINSTMLFEGVLLGRPALSLKYVEFQQIWEEAGIPFVRTRDELFAILPTLLGEPAWAPDPEKLARAAQLFSNGEFDGRASRRIASQLRQIAKGERQVPHRQSTVHRLVHGQTGQLDVVALAGASKLTPVQAEAMRAMLRARTMVDVPVNQVNLKRNVSASEAFVDWPAADHRARQNLVKLARELNRPKVTVTEGLVGRSRRPLEERQLVSLMIDDLAMAYDPIRVKRLVKLRSTDGAEERVARARALIDLLVAKRLSSYHELPVLTPRLGEPGRRKVMVIDQLPSNPALDPAAASPEDFERMVHDVLREEGDAEVIVYSDPAGIGEKAGANGCFAQAYRQFQRYVAPVDFYDADISPYSLFEIVDTVYVGDSVLGLEALMAGKRVHCYGKPFYAGLGLTVDRCPAIPLPEETATIEELVYLMFVRHGRYVSSQTGQACSVEEAAEEVIAARGW
ncbi:hypothetical protein [Zavarzinia sp.]|uniref:capsular polysaccharide export protein, LipB/KpsS family n=1 Tax=Zavarzinia sp. TaxID=2027920 RepID=UPI0035696F66